MGARVLDCDGTIAMISQEDAWEVRVGDEVTQKVYRLYFRPDRNFTRDQADDIGGQLKAILDDINRDRGERS